MRDTTIPTEQILINRINAKTEFTFPSKARIPDVEPELLHRSHNPSLKYDDIYRDVYNAVGDIDSVLVGVRHFDGSYDVLRYKK